MPDLVSYNAGGQVPAVIKIGAFTVNSFSARSGASIRAMAQVIEFLTNSRYAHRAGDPTICDFVAGNPHEMPLPGFVDALEKWVVPKNKDWFAYKNNEPEAQRTVAESLRARHSRNFQPDDVFLTNGAFAALAVCLFTVLDPGDEVIYLSPPWFFYEAMIEAYGGKPVGVPVSRASFEPDLDAVRAAITPRTRAILVNSPNNPTGKIYSPEVLKGLGALLTEASERNGRPIYLISDEAYCRILYDGRSFTSPTAYYPHAFLVYTYGKTLLTPGQRIGYVALPPEMPNRESIRVPLMGAQLMVGFAFPNALLQHAIADLEALSIDIDQLQRRRDRMVPALRDMGYELHSPEATFYLLPKSPTPDDRAFVNRLADHDVFCLPGSVVEMPGTFRISLTANDAMIEQSLPGFEAAIGGA